MKTIQSLLSRIHRRFQTLGTRLKWKWQWNDEDCKTRGYWEASYRGYIILYHNRVCQVEGSDCAVLGKSLRSSERSVIKILNEACEMKRIIEKENELKQQHLSSSEMNTLMMLR